MSGAGACLDEDALGEECGVFGVFNVAHAARVTAFGLHALQHRGQEGCGIATSDGDRFWTRRRAGLVGEHFSDPDLSKQLKGRHAVGHVRYSTAGPSVERNLQPLQANLRTGGFAIAHNGHLVNAQTLRAELVERGVIFQTDSDTEVIVHLLAASREDDVVDSLREALRTVQGGYAIAALTDHHLIAARDPTGLRPLVLGKLDEGWVVASETTALDMVGARYVRDLLAGEVVVIDANGVTSYPVDQDRPPTAPRTCAFEYIYFSRPDSRVDGRSVYDARKRMGRLLARSSRARADIVVPVPDSGMPAAIGFAQESGLPMELGIIRSHHVGRTFIQPGPKERDLKVRMKHRPNASVLAGRRVVLVDDSIVRGTPSRKIVRMVKDAGAKEVHFRSASPPIRHPDFYGIDMPKQSDLLAARFKTLKGMARHLGADSVDFLSVEDLYLAILEEPRDPLAPQLAEHYFTGVYPTQRPDLDPMPGGEARQLHLLAEAV